MAVLLKDWLKALVQNATIGHLARIWWLVVATAFWNARNFVEQRYGMAPAFVTDAAGWCDRLQTAKTNVKFPALGLEPIMHYFEAAIVYACRLEAAVPALRTGTSRSCQ